MNDKKVYCINCKFVRGAFYRWFFSPINWRCRPTLKELSYQTGKRYRMGSKSCSISNIVGNCECYEEGRKK